MRGIPSLITDIRKKVFTEVARMAYSGNGYEGAEDLPFKIVPGDQPLHRESIFLERAIAGERVRLAMGLSIRPVQTRSLMTEGMDAAAIAALLQARCERLTDIPEKVDFFDALPDYDGALFTNKKSKTDPEVARAMLEAAIPALEGLDGWTTEGIHDALIALAEKLAVKNATLMWPVRIAAAGKAVTPGGAVEICHILGKDECLRRLRLGLDKLGG